MPGAYLWGWDTANWQKVITDAAGHLQVDVLTAPAVDTHCYGYDGAAWRALHTDVAGDLQVDILTIPITTVQCQGYDGAAWRNLHTDAAGDLQVDVLTSSLPTGAATSANQTTEITALQLIDDLRNALGSVNTDDLQVDIKDIADGEIKCYGYDGAAWQTLLVEDSTDFNLRTRLYAGANAIEVGTPADVMTNPTYTLKVNSFNQFWTGSRWSRPIMQSNASDNLGTASSVIAVIASLWGFDGSTFDRLRTYGTGILKVGRAEVGLSTAFLQGTGAVKASAGVLYWITLNAGAGNARITLSNDLNGSGAAVYALQCLQASSKHVVLDPPKEFSTGIYLKTFTNAGDVIFGYI